MYTNGNSPSQERVGEEGRSGERSAASIGATRRPGGRAVATAITSHSPAQPADRVRRVCDAGCCARREGRGMRERSTMRCVWGEWPCKAASEGIRTGDPRLEEGQSERDGGSTTKAVLEIAERGCDARTAAPSVQGRVRTGRVHATKRVGWSKTRVDVRQNKSGERETEMQTGRGERSGHGRGREGKEQH